MASFSGSCLCGQVHFEAAGFPKRVALCHCFTCRKSTGSAFAAFAIYENAAVNVNGVVTAYATSARERRYRCRYCGSPVYDRGETGDEIELPLGAFDRTNLFRPQYEAWTTRRENWLPSFGPDVPSFERNQHSM